MTTCKWFAHCDNEADKDVEHSTLGWVPTCDAHIAWLGDDPSPTQFIPPIVADRMARWEALVRTV